MKHLPNRLITLLITATVIGAPHVNAQEVVSDNVVLLPVIYRHYELSASGILDPLPEESEAGKANLTAASVQAVDAHDRFTVVELPDLTAEEQALLDEHAALLDLVIPSSVLIVTSGARVWSHKKNSYDYSIGPGLAPLAEKLGIDKAVFIGGAKVSASGGRVLTMLIVAAAAGAVIPLGGGAVFAGVVDLRTGRIEWIERVNIGSQVPDTMENAEKLALRTIEDFPKTKIVKGYAR